MTTYELVLPYTRPPLSLNQRIHWTKQRITITQIKSDASWLALQAKLPKAVPFTDIELVYYPPDNRRRDDHNITPTLKAAVDGLVRYGLVADDDSQHVRSWCTIGPKHPGGKVALNITVHPAGP